MTEEQLFLAALDLPNETAQAAYLANACGDDEALRGKVEALLANHFRSGEFLNVPVVEQLDTGACADFPVTIQGEVMTAEQSQHDDSGDLSFLTPSTRPDSLGRIGHYEALQVLGKGGFGIVLRAFDEILQRVVAIKVMAPQLAATSPARKRFLREARSSAQVRHENVVQVYEVAEQPLPYLAMEFIPGETLQQRLDRTGPLEIQETLRIGRQIAEGLAAAHATDLIHRDIKPGNVLLEGSQHKVKITDFGLARAADDASITQTGMIAGTPMYMAPEQALGQPLDQRADLFSLGSVLYQMAAGRPPFRANSTVAVLKRVADDTPRPIREIIPETPQWLCDIIAKLHAKNPDDRYQSAREVADVLADCEGQLKANSKLKDFTRIPRSKQPAVGKSGSWKWVAAAIMLLPVLALAATEFAGVTDVFWQQATSDPNPIKPGSEVALDRGLDPPGSPSVRPSPIQLDPPIPVSPPTRLPTGDENVTALAFGPDGRQVFTTGDLAGGNEGSRLWDVATGKEIRNFGGQTHWGSAADFTLDGIYVLAGSFDSNVRVYETATARLVRTFDRHANPVSSVAISPDARFALSSTWGGNKDDDLRILYWDLTTGNLILALKGHDGSIAQVAISPDGRRALSAGADATVRAWDLGTGKEVWKVSGDASPDHAPRAAFTPDGRHIVWADDGGLRLADAATGKEVLRLSGPLGPLSSIDMSADGSRVLVCSGHNYGNWVRVWDLSTGVLLHHIAGGSDKLTTSQLSADGKRAAAGTFRQGTLVWTLPDTPRVLLRPVSPTASPAEKTPTTVVKKELLPPT